MKRKKKKTGLLLLALTAVLFTACTVDDADTDRQNPNPDTAGLTAFVMEDSTDSPATRLVGEHTGSGVRFYWSRWDNILVDNPTEYTEWRADKENNIYDLTNDRYRIVDGACIPKAKFLFEGEFTKPEYRVRYLGRNSSAKYADQVYIREDGNYIGPQLVTSGSAQTGDFATGIAHRQADGTYTFQLEHKASYITFRPYSTQKAFRNAVGGEVVWSIEVSADQALCGWFDIKGDTIDLSSRPTDERYKKISCAGAMNYLLKIPSEAFSADDHSYAIMVVAPGTYTNFTVRYRFGPNFNFSTGYVTKTYPRVTFTAGKNKVISQKIQVEEYPADTYYMWDAAEPYWKGYEWNSANPAQPLGGPGTDHYPKSNADSRWYNEVPSYAGADGAAPAVAASRSCKDCPNINELLWYWVYGAPYFDNEVYVLMDHVWCGRVWLKKLSTIARELGKTVAELKEKAPDGVDYTRSTKIPDMDSFHAASEKLESGKPNNMADYFSLPFLGGYGPTEDDFRPSNPKRWMHGNTPGAAHYWSSTPTPGSPDKAYVWEVDPSKRFRKIDIKPENRQYGFSRMWPADR